MFFFCFAIIFDCYLKLIIQERSIAFTFNALRRKIKLNQKQRVAVDLIFRTMRLCWDETICHMNVNHDKNSINEFFVIESIRYIVQLIHMNTNKKLSFQRCLNYHIIFHQRSLLCFLRTNNVPERFLYFSNFHIKFSIFCICFILLHLCTDISI